MRFRAGFSPKYRRWRCPIRGGTRWSTVYATVRNSCGPCSDRRVDLEMPESPFPGSSAPTLGRVVATERRPNTPHEFHFWTALDSPVGIGTIVRVDARDEVNGVYPRVYGIVTEGFSWTDLASPLHDVMGHDANPADKAVHQTNRAEIRLYTAAVLRHVPEE